jgi:hypothetical protein
MERYHLPPDVTYKDKIKVLCHMCDGKAREQLDMNPRDSTYDDYVAMWQLLYDLVGDDGAQASALWSHLTAATPKSSSYTNLAEYALDMQSTADKLTILQAGTDDNIWTSAWRAVLLHATEAFNSFKLQEPELGQCFMREPHHYYETRPREKFMQFWAFLDYQARQERNVNKSAVMNAQIHTKKSGKDNRPRNEKKAYPAEAALAAKNESKAASTPPGNKKRDGPKPCQSCLESHPTRECPVTDLDERKALFGKARRCFNCGRVGHQSADCRSTGRCRNCAAHEHEDEKHHTLLCPHGSFDEGHGTDGSAQRPANNSGSSSSGNSSRHNHSSMSRGGPVSSSPSGRSNAPPSGRGGFRAPTLSHDNDFAGKVEAIVAAAYAKQMAQQQQSAANNGPSPQGGPSTSCGNEEDNWVPVQLTQTRLPTNSYPEFIQGHVLKTG